MTKHSILLSTDAKSSIIVSKDNRIRLWDFASSKEKRNYVEKNHLSHSYTCSQWKQTKGDELGLFVVGTSDGKVIVWDLSRGVVLRSIDMEGDVPPTDVTFSKDASSVFVSSSHNHIMEYNVKTGEVVKQHKALKKGTMKMCLHPTLDLLAIGSTVVKLLDISSGKRRKLAAAYPHGTHSLHFSPCGQYLICYGESAREILLYDITRTEDEDIAPICVLGCADILNMVSLRRVADGVVDVLQVTENHTASISRVTIGSTDIAQCKIQSSEKVLSGAFLAENNKIRIVTGKSTKPSGFVITYAEAAGMLPSVSLTVEAVAKDTKVYEALTAPVVMTPKDMAADRKRPSTALEENDDAVSKKMRNGDAEKTLEERLMELSAAAAKEEAREADDSTAAPTTDSLVALLEQALQANDEEMLEQCLRVEDMSVVEETTKRLPVQRVIPFLEKLLAKFEKRPSRGLLMTKWLSCMMKHHMSYLISIPNLPSQLAGLSQLLEQRLNSYTKLTTLSGRLDLLMSQMKTVSSGSKSDVFVPQEVYYEE